MRIVLDLPDWVQDRRISILAGMEQVAEKLPGQPWMMKVARCQLCGVCCADCEHLKEREGYRQGNGEWARMCELNVRRPYSCCIGDGHGVAEGCAIKWEEASEEAP